jgi:ATP-dependent exoDNAse (exonuclease V) alpha subunit
MGIACLQESKINFKYTKYFLNEDNKKYVVEKTRILSNIFKGNETDEKNGELRLFSTIHATQGKTCPIGNNVIIIIDKYFDFNLYYTALSRAKTLNQIYIIKDFN